MTIIKLLISFFILFNAITLGVLGIYYLSFVFIFLSIIILTSLFISVKYFKTFLFLSLLVSILLVPFSLTQATNGIRKLGDKVLSPQGPKSLTYLERGSLYYASLGMSVGGLIVGAKNTAYANFLLHIPGPKERIWYGDYVMKSKKISNFVNKHSKAKTPYAKMELWWKPYWEEVYDIALTFNGGELIVTNDDKGCKARAVSFVRYGKQYRNSTILNLRGYRLRIDQATFWALQELNMLHPYDLYLDWDC